MFWQPLLDVCKGAEVDTIPAGDSCDLLKAAARVGVVNTVLSVVVCGGAILVTSGNVASRSGVVSYAVLDAAVERRSGSLMGIVGAVLCMPALDTSVVIVLPASSKHVISHVRHEPSLSKFALPAHHGTPQSIVVQL